MKHFKLFILFVVAIVFAACSSKSKQALPEWKVGIQTYTFHKFTLMEALDKTQELGLHYAEAFFSQPLGGELSDTVYLNFDLPPVVQQQLKEEFSKRDITLYALGVASYDSAEDWEHFFVFAKDMGVHTVTCEPKLEQLDMVEQLAIKYNIEVAIHNHPQPSVYANPDVLLKALEGRNSIMGVCADIGHWKRSGYDSLETLRRFAGRLKVIHFKDLNDKMEDTVWGAGILNISKILEELKHQNFDGLISIEYEDFGDSQFNDIVRSLEYYGQHTR